MMKNITSIVLVVFSMSFSTAQINQYDFHKDKPIIYLDKDSILNRDSLREHIVHLKSELGKSRYVNEQYWLNNRIAFALFLADKLEYERYAIDSYNKSKERFCREYLEYNLLNEYDSTVNLNQHYLEVSKNIELVEIKENCCDKFEKSERFKLNRRMEKEKMNDPNSQYNKKYYNALKNIGKDDQKERKKGDNMDWDIQNSLDESNRHKLDSLFTLYGMPYVDVVSSEGLMLAFMVLHHSTDCEWNEKTTRRFLVLDEEIEEHISQLFSFYLYRNYNEQDGICSEKANYFEGLRFSKDSIFIKKSLDFSVWEKRFNKK